MQKFTNLVTLRPIFSSKYFSKNTFLLMDNVADVDIDKNGKFKYILINVVDSKSGKEKLIVRGYGRCNYHSKVFKLSNVFIVYIK